MHGWMGRLCDGRETSSLIKTGLGALLLLSAGGAMAEDARQGDEAVEELLVLGQQVDDRRTQVGKLDVPLTEMPFSVTVLDREFLRTMGAKTVQDSLTYTAGVAAGPYGVDVRGDWSTIRGSSPVIYVDGLKALHGFYNNTRPSTEVMSRVEILKGPSSVLYGQGTTGGVVNLVSRLPEDESSGEFFLRGGSFDHLAAGADVTGALDRDGRLLYRLVGYYRDADAQVDHTSDDSFVLSPSLTWRPDARSSITLLGHLQRDRSGTTTAFLPWQGTQLDNPNGRIPTDAFLSEPGWDRYDTDQESITLLAERVLTEQWRIRFAGRYTEGSSDYHSLWPIFTGSGERFEDDLRTLTRTAYDSDASSEALAYDLRLHGQVETGALSQRLQFGFDAQDATTDNDTYYGYAAGGTIDAFDPVYGNVPTGYTVNDGPETDTEQQGLYFQDQLRLDRWILSLGGRHDWTRSKTAGGTARKDEATTWRGGLMYAFDAGFTPYVSYTESFEPVAGADSAGNPFKPIEGEQVEIGVKYQPSGSPTLLTLAVYDITQSNRLTSDPLNPTGQIQTGKVKIEGVEFAASTRIHRLELLFNYAWLDGDRSAADVSSDLGVVPEQQLSTWATWHFSNALTGWALGAGMRYTDSPLDAPANVRPSAYTLFDAMLRYQQGPWQVRLNARNLTDKVHVTACLGRGDCYYGERRYVTAEIGYRF